MEDPRRPNISGVCWVVSKINQQRFNENGDILGSDIPKSQELEKVQH